jgi:hypothetical protein
MILALLTFASLSAGAGAPFQAGSSQSKADSIEAAVLRRLRAQDSARATRIAMAEPQRRSRPQAREVTAADLASAFKDPAARTLLTRARVARMGQDSALVSYDAQSYQRISAGISFARIGRDRLIFRSEHAGRVRWHRASGIWIDLTGSRTVLPGTPDIAQREAGKGIAEAGGEIVPVPYFPGYEALWAGPMAAKANVDENGPVHPLAIGSEAYYTYRTGDSISLTLPDRRQFRLHSLEVRPRTADWRMMVGTLWFDVASAQLVRAAYRFAAPMHIDQFVLEQDPTAFDDVPAWVKPMMFPLKGEISAITIEYGLYGGRFWLPRNRSAEGHGIASFVRVPFKVEQTFKYNSVNGLDSLPRIPIAQWNPQVIRPPDGMSDSARRAWRDSVVVTVLRQQRARRDSIADGLLRPQRRLSQCDTSAVRMRTDRRYGNSQVPVASRTPCDLSSIVNSPDLPASIYDPGDELFDLKARDELVSEALKMGAQPAFSIKPSMLPRAQWEPWLSQMRYNRIEGVSAGAQVSQTFGGGYSVRAVGRFGVADLKPNLELGVLRTNQSHTLFLGGYTHLVSAGDWGSPLNFSSSLSALLFGRDEGFYYRRTGIEFGGRTERTPLVEWRVFSERHETANVETTFGLGSRNSLPNIAASGSQYFGTGVRVRANKGDNPNGFRIFGDMRVEGATTIDSVYARGALDLTFTQGVGEHWGGALTLSAGSSLGDVPSQRRWYLGGTRTIRGQTPDTTQSGNAFWMSRFEFGRAIQGARPVLFADFGWAGDRTQWHEVGRPMSGVGIGVSLLDGLLRFDVGRGIAPRQQWRVDAYLEGVF